jgi:RNA polymerase sigma-70 factor (ECF subfamily)
LPEICPANLDTDVFKGCDKISLHFFRLAPTLDVTDSGSIPVFWRFSSKGVSAFVAEMKLNEIATVWTDIFSAHADDTGEAIRGKAAVLERYMGAVQGYLNDAVRDRHLAEDLAQDFAFRFLRGDFQGADPARGKFRGYLKTVLRNQVIDYFRKNPHKPVAVQEHMIVDGQPDAETSLDQLFRDNWRKEILRQTWLKMESSSDTGGKRFYMVLQTRVEFPEYSSAQMASVISERLGESVRPDWVRQNLRRARESFASLLRTEIALTLEADEGDAVDEELALLDLKKYCV